MHICSIAKVSRSLYCSLKCVGEHLEHVDLHGPSPAGRKISTEPGAAFCWSPSTTRAWTLGGLSDRHQESLEAKVVGVAVGLGLRYLLRCSLGKVGCRTFQMEPGSILYVI